MKKNKKIYILTSGSYSDYIIEAVCSTRQLAQELKLANSWEIEEYTIDARNNDFQEAKELIKRGYKNYIVRMTRSGEVTQIKNGRDCWESISDIIGSKRDKTDLGFDFGGILYCFILAKNDAQAIKIANDKRAFLITNNQWEK